MSFADCRLETRRLRLRPLEEGDAPALLALFSDPQVMRYWSTPPWTGIERALQTIASDRESMAAGEHLRLAITRRDDPLLIGTCTLFNLVPACRRAEIGYALAPAHQGHAYMDEALRALLRHGFTTMQLNRVEADIDPRNEASARTLERLGFRREGLLRQRWVVDGEVSDSAIYGLLHADWYWRQ